ncbi:MAG: ATP-binding cassette domain-containing protein [Puniceicoccaceae bacterium]|nr:MAG: ATP-binding cassette domain-containing protein [Puniceicoccaceae bacterium]
MSQIVVESLTKVFRIAERRAGLRGALAGLVRRRNREVRALDGVCFQVGRGELVGYIGPNGAGKSTTVKVLSGILVPTSGTCEVDGRIPWRDRRAHVRNLGVVFGQRTQLWWDLPVVESFELLRDLYAIPADRFRAVGDELTRRLDLGGLLNVPVRQLSLGQRMRCDLAAALLHEPGVLFLDEPTIGLDAASKLAMREVVRTINREQGVTVILTTHDMDDIESLCQRVLVVAEGKILCDGSLASLRRTVSSERHLIVDLAEGISWNGLDGLPAREVEVAGGRVRLGFDPENVAAAELIGRLTARYPVRDLLVENPPIEEVIAKLYAGGKA